MKILAINGGTNGSSWDICYSILVQAMKCGHSVCAATPDKKPQNLTINYYKIGNSLSRLFYKITTRVDGSDGFKNYLDTKKLIKFIISFKPDVVHLHTLHGYFINIEILVDFLKRNNIHLVITCHDCWWFTGRCSHFYSNNCEKWKTDCAKCKFKNVYPRALLFDKAKKYLLRKKNLFVDYKNLDVICVSNWLSNLCRESFVFENKNIRTIYNGIKLIKYNIGEKDNYNSNSIISVASQWTENKGLNQIIKLANKFPMYNFLLVGNLDDKIFKKNIINIGYIKSKQELFDLYKQCKFLLNVSKQETFSLVNVEAQMCGLPVVSFSKTGMGETICPECFFVENYTTEDFSSAIQLAENSDINHFKIKEFAERFSEENMCAEYMKIYNK